MLKDPDAKLLKDPDAKLPYTVDWTAWLAAEEDTLASITWVVPDGLTKDAESTDGGKATIWLSGGTLGQNHQVVCRITTTGGRIDDRVLKVSIRER